MARVLTVKRGDTQTWELTVKENGSAVDISAASAAVVYMRKSGGSTNKINGEAATIVDDGTVGLRGRIDYTPDAADVDDDGWFDAYFRITWAGGVIARFPSDETHEKAIRITKHLEA